MTDRKIDRVTVVGGARPNFVKIAPVVRALAARGLKVRIVHTGQHYDEAMSRSFFRDLGIPEPDVDLGVGSGSHGEQTGRVIERFEADLLENPADAVMVVGDVNSTFAAALAAVKLGVAVAHVESGLRSFDRLMPEEINRILTDHISDWLFATEESALKNLENEGIAASRVFMVGNVMIDSLESGRATWQAGGRLEVAPAEGPYAVMTLHRPRNVDDRETLEGILGAMEDLGKKMPVVFPVHPRTAARLKAFNLEKRLSGIKGMTAVKPMSYLAFLKLFSHSALILTDSGGAQEEALVLGVPCVTLRETTERPVTLDMGGNRLVGNDPGRIRKGIAEALRTDRSRLERPPLWDGRAAERIVEILLKE